MRSAGLGTGIPRRGGARGGAGSVRPGPPEAAGPRRGNGVRRVPPAAQRAPDDSILLPEILPPIAVRGRLVADGARGASGRGNRSRAGSRRSVRVRGGRRTGFPRLRKLRPGAPATCPGHRRVSGARRESSGSPRNLSRGPFGSSGGLLAACGRLRGPRRAWDGRARPSNAGIHGGFVRERRPPGKTGGRLWRDACGSGRATDGKKLSHRTTSGLGDMRRKSFGTSLPVEPDTLRWDSDLHLGGFEGSSSMAEARGGFLALSAVDDSGSGIAANFRGG